MFKINGENKKYKIVWRVLFAVTVIADIICCLFLNGLGGAGLYMNNYQNAGIGLFVSAVFLTASVCTLGKGRMMIPAILDIIGSAGYIYAISVLSAIPHEKIPKENVEPLIARIYPAIAVSVLIFVIVITNFFSPYQEAKRDAKRRAKWEAEQRPLSKDEKIL